MSEPISKASLASPLTGEAYLDIVWRQFRKNKMAYASLWLLLPLFLTALFAPVIASDIPFAFRDSDAMIYPWFNALFNPAEPVDYFFNMALLAVLPWSLWAGISIVLQRRKGKAAHRWVPVIAGEYVLCTVAVCLLFSFENLRPLNEYNARNFGVDEFNSQGESYGWYAPLSFGPLENDAESMFKPPLYRKPEFLVKELRRRFKQFEVEADGTLVLSNRYALKKVLDRDENGVPTRIEVDLLDSQGNRRSYWHDANDKCIHLMGTDNTGRDVLVRMIHGTRIAMSVGVVAVSLYLVIGVVAGSVAGYFGGRVDMVISRAIEVMMLFPAFFLILTLVALIGPSIYIIMVVIGITRWTGIARLTRGEVLKQRAIDYVSAARAQGASHTRIIFRHILPNSLSPALVAAPFGIAGAIVTEAGLSLLGFGVQPPAPSWGVLLRLGHGNYNCWWVIVFPSLAIFITVTLFNLVGSGLRDAMDPRLRA